MEWILSLIFKVIDLVCFPLSFLLWRRFASMCDNFFFKRNFDFPVPSLATLLFWNQGLGRFIPQAAISASSDSVISCWCFELTMAGAQGLSFNTQARGVFKVGTWGLNAAATDIFSPLKEA